MKVSTSDKKRDSGGNFIAFTICKKFESFISTRLSFELVLRWIGRHANHSDYTTVLFLTLLKMNI